MKKKNLWLGILAITLVFTMTVVSCDNGTTDDGYSSVPKAIAITGIAASYSYGNIRLFPVGTSLADVNNGVGFVAGAAYNNSDVLDLDYSITYPLYNPGTNTGRWTGSGSYDVYWYYNTPSGSTVKLYKASSVSFTSATTTVAFSKFSEI